MSKKYILELIRSSESQVEKELRSITISDFKKILYTALKEQDRDTRHACADKWDENSDVCFSNCINCNDGVSDVEELRGELNV